MDASNGFRGAETYMQVINFNKWRHEVIVSYQSSFPASCDKSKACGFSSVPRPNCECSISNARSKPHIFTLWKAGGSIYDEDMVCSFRAGAFAGRYDRRDRS